MPLYRSSTPKRSMEMTNHRTTDVVTRRTALTGLTAGGVGLALAATARQVAAQDATPPTTADHRIVGSWMVWNTPPNIGVFSGNGTIVNIGVGSHLEQDQTVIVTPGAGSWEAI